MSVCATEPQLPIQLSRSYLTLARRAETHARLNAGQKTALTHANRIARAESAGPTYRKSTGDKFTGLRGLRRGYHIRGVRDKRYGAVCDSAAVSDASQ